MRLGPWGGWGGGGGGGGGLRWRATPDYRSKLRSRPRSPHHRLKTPRWSSLGPGADAPLPNVERSKFTSVTDLSCASGRVILNIIAWPNFTTYNDYVKCAARASDCRKSPRLPVKRPEAELSRSGLAAHPKRVWIQSALSTLSHIYRASQRIYSDHMRDCAPMVSVRCGVALITRPHRQC